jgi:hypothetical protein
MIPLSTPVSYLANAALEDPFDSAYVVTGMKDPSGAPSNAYVWAYYKWTGNGGGVQGFPQLTFGDAWTGVPNVNACVMESMGPGADPSNKIHWVPEWSLAYYHGLVNQQDVITSAPDPATACDQFYDPSNGTVSGGGIARYMGETQGMPAYGF